ncbi:hypothetical protein [Micromonospora musae]|nr:hypothetical protein [Micromonospora musae]
MSAHIFVDETKERGLLVAAAVVLTRDLAPARKVMRSLILPNQRRIHFHKNVTTDAGRPSVRSTGSVYKR